MNLCLLPGDLFLIFHNTKKKTLVTCITPVVKEDNDRGFCFQGELGKPFPRSPLQPENGCFVATGFLIF